MQILLVVTDKHHPFLHYSFNLPIIQKLNKQKIKEEKSNLKLFHNVLLLNHFVPGIITN